jgi:hypothetical protein
MCGTVMEKEVEIFLMRCSLRARLSLERGGSNRTTEKNNQIS